MRKLRMEDAYEGLILAKTVTLKQNIILLPKGTSLRKSSLVKLEKYKIEYIFVEDKDVFQEEDDAARDIRLDKQKITSSLDEKFQRYDNHSIMDDLKAATESYLLTHGTTPESLPE